MFLDSDDSRPLLDVKRENGRELAESFKQLLSEEHPEQTYQRYLEQHTQLIPRDFEQNHGIHFELAIRKLPFGADFVSDFFFLSKSSDDWNCVFIELESPHASLFRGNSNNLSAKLLAGINQIDTWRAWLSSGANQAHFTETTIGPLRHPLGQNPCFMKYILVIGRRREYEENELRRATIRAKEREDFKILTYDSLMENLDRKFPLYVGSRTNSGIDLLSDKLVGSSIFGWLAPELIGVNNVLLEQIKAHRTNEYRNSPEGGGFKDAFRVVENRLRLLR